LNDARDVCLSYVTEGAAGGYGAVPYLTMYTTEHDRYCDGRLVMDLDATSARPCVQPTAEQERVLFSQLAQCLTDILKHRGFDTTHFMLNASCVKDYTRNPLKPSYHVVCSGVVMEWTMMRTVVEHAAQMLSATLQQLQLELDLAIYNNQNQGPGLRSLYSWKLESERKETMLPRFHVPCMMVNANAVCKPLQWNTCSRELLDIFHRNSSTLHPECHLAERATTTGRGPFSGSDRVAEVPDYVRGVFRQWLAEHDRQYFGVPLGQSVGGVDDFESCHTKVSKKGRRYFVLQLPQTHYCRVKAGVQGGLSADLAQHNAAQTCVCVYADRVVYRCTGQRVCKSHLRAHDKHVFEICHPGDDRCFRALSGEHVRSPLAGDDHPSPDMEVEEQGDLSDLAGFVVPDDLEWTDFTTDGMELENWVSPSVAAVEEEQEGQRSPEEEVDESGLQWYERRVPRASGGWALDGGQIYNLAWFSQRCNMDFGNNTAEDIQQARVNLCTMFKQYLSGGYIRVPSVKHSSLVSHLSYFGKLVAVTATGPAHSLKVLYDDASLFITHFKSLVVLSCSDDNGFLHMGNMKYYSTEGMDTWCPEFKYRRGLFSFDNGLLLATPELKFATWEELFDAFPRCQGQIRELYALVGVPAQSFAGDFQPLWLQRHPTDLVREYGQPVYQISQSQQWQETTMMALLALLGRTVFPHRKYDGWQFFMYLYGHAGTGKSTMVNMCKRWFRKAARATWNSKNSHTFNSDLLKGDTILCDDIGIDVPKEWMEWMMQFADGEVDMKMDVKHERPIQVSQVDATVCVAGNKRPGHSSQVVNFDEGQLNRRLALWSFVRPVTRNTADGSMGDTLKQNAVPMLVASLQLYNLFRKAMGNIYFEDGLHCLAPEMQTFKDNVMNAHPVRVYAEEKLLFKAVDEQGGAVELFVPEATLKKHFQQWLTENNHPSSYASRLVEDLKNHYNVKRFTRSDSQVNVQSTWIEQPSKADWDDLNKARLKQERPWVALQGVDLREWPGSLIKAAMTVDREMSSVRAKTFRRRAATINFMRQVQAYYSKGCSPSNAQLEQQIRDWDSKYHWLRMVFF